MRRMWPWLRRGLRPALTIRAVSLMVALIGLVLAADRYGRENRDADASWVTQQFRLLQRGGPVERRFAADELAGAGADELERVAPALVDLSRDADPDIRIRATRALARLVVRFAPAAGGALPPPLAGALGPLIEGLEDPDAGVRRTTALALEEVAEALGRIAPGELARSAWLEGAVKPLLAHLGDVDAEVRAASAEALGAVHGLDREAPPELMRLIADPAPSVRRAALRVLRKPWPNHFAIREALSPMALEPQEPGKPLEGSESHLAALAISGHGPPAPELLDLLTARLGSGIQESGDRDVSISLLLAFGRHARPALPALLRVVVDPATDRVSFQVARAMLEIDSSAPATRSAIRVLAERAVRPHFEDEVEASSAFVSRTSGRDGELLAWLRGQVEDPDPGVRGRSIRLIQELSADSASAWLSTPRPVDGEK